MRGWDDAGQVATTAILRWVVVLIILVFLLFVGVALVLGIPLLKGIGLAAGAATPAVPPPRAFGHGNPVEDVLQAFFDGIVAVVNAIIGGIVLLISTAFAALATIFKLLFVSPFQFFAAGFASATASLEGFGIAGPVAVVIVLITAMAVVGVAGYLAVQGVKTLLPGDQ
jgi:hypothetical protein